LDPGGPGGPGVGPGILRGLITVQDISPGRHGGHYHYQDPSMKNQNLSLLARLSLAFGSFFSIIMDRQFAAKVDALRGDAAPTSPVDLLRSATPDAALQLLGLLQREARFIDFIEEDIAAYADADIGNAARVVHEGCRKVLHDNFAISPVRGEAEGSKITLAAGFDAAAIRLTGNVVGQPPFFGSLAHRGWRVEQTHLPRIASGHDLSIVAPAEVEL
jgi:hypothetical protein